MKEELIIHFNNIDNTQSLNDYIFKKLSKSKYKDFHFTSVNFKKLHTGGTNKYEVTVVFRLGHVSKALQVRGDDVYALVDTIDSKLSNQVSKVKKK